MKKPKNKRRFGFPQFKKKHSFKQSYKTNFTNDNIQVRENYLKLPKLAWIKFHKSQEIAGNIINVTVTRTTTGRYIASILCECEIEIHPHTDKAVGLDLGVKSYLVTSDNDVVNNPKYYRTQQRKLRKASKKLSRSSKDNSNRVSISVKKKWGAFFIGYIGITTDLFCFKAPHFFRSSLVKAKTKLALVHERIANTREDFLHKLSTRLIRENAIICIEDLGVKNMAKNRKLAKSIMDCGWSMFVSMLEYKALWHDKVVQKISRFYPSVVFYTCVRDEALLKL